MVLFFSTECKSFLVREGDNRGANLVHPWRLEVQANG